MGNTMGNTLEAAAADAASAVATPVCVASVPAVIAAVFVDRAIRSAAAVHTELKTNRLKTPKHRSLK